MKEIDELDLPQEFKYAQDHEWAKSDEDAVIIGISDYAQEQLGEIVYVELPQVGDSFLQGEEFGSVESVKAVSELYIPVSGEVIQINEALENAPELVNDACNTEGWLIRVKPSDLDQMDALMDQAAYLKMLKG